MGFQFFGVRKTFYTSRHTLVLKGLAERQENVVTPKADTGVAFGFHI